MVTNDQGRGLVDTALAHAAGVPVGEVGGGCFCCRLTDLLRATDALETSRPDVMFAEPVAAASISQRPSSARCCEMSPAVPNRTAHRARGSRPRACLTRPGADPDLAYLFRQQLAEADIVCATKADKDNRPPLEIVPGTISTLPGVVAHRLSARTGEGVDAWLDHVLGDRVPAGELPLVQLDFRRYAAAEAALAWLNWHAEVSLEAPLPPAFLAGARPITSKIELACAGLAIVHVKVSPRPARDTCG